MSIMGTIWLRTGTMPHWLAFHTYPLALIMLLSFSSNIYFLLIFPSWMFVISVYILFENLRSRPASAESSPERE